MEEEPTIEDMKPGPKKNTREEGYTLNARISTLGAYLKFRFLG